MQSMRRNILHRRNTWIEAERQPVLLFCLHDSKQNINRLAKEVKTALEHKGYDFTEAFHLLKVYSGKNHNWLYTLLCTVFSLESFGRHKQHNRFPMILRYWKPRNLVLKPNKPIYKWLWWCFVPKH